MEITTEKLRAIIYNYVSDVFGQSEADDPSWAIEPLAEHIAKELNEGDAA